MIKPFFESKTKPIFISEYEYSYDFPSHFHPNLEIAFCFKGSQTVKIGDDLFTLYSGDSLIIFPNSVHEYIKTDDKGTSSISVICSLDYIEPIFGNILNYRSSFPIVRSENLSKTTYSAFKKMENAKNNTELLGWTYIVLSDIMGKIEIETHKKYDTSFLPGMITSYIDENYQKSLTIKELSLKFGYSPSYIAHIFCDRLKVPFKTYLGSVRCENAAKEIIKGRKSITQIAYSNGFNSLNSFCRCFKKHYKLTPSEYKKTNN